MSESQLIPIVNADKAERIGDVIFVHGLGGNARGTWHPQGKQDDDNFWPFWLGQELSDVGIWSLGYAVEPFRWKGETMPLVDRATSTLALLDSYDIGERPLIFIAHSLGGLLVKQMLRHAQDFGPTRWKAIVNQTKGIVFLSTPHSGADIASWISHIGKLLGTTVSVDELKANDPRLRELNIVYRSHEKLNKIPMEVYYEKQKTSGILVVNETSADPGILGVIPIPMDYDHVSICRPTSKESLIYRRVKRFVKDNLALATRTQQERTEPTSDSENQVVEVFFSYAHEDEKLRDELAKHLKLLERQGAITAWYDREITAGTEWKGQIDEHLESAKVILLLVSADFLASDYCYDVELKRAMKRHEAREARVIPVILREVDWQGASFGKLQALPRNAEPVTNWPNLDQAFADIARGIRRAVEELTGKKVLNTRGGSSGKLYNVPEEPPHFLQRPDEGLKRAIAFLKLLNSLPHPESLEDDDQLWKVYKSVYEQCKPPDWKPEVPMPETPSALLAQVNDMGQSDLTVSGKPVKPVMEFLVRFLAQSDSLLLDKQKKVLERWVLEQVSEGEWLNLMNYMRQEHQSIEQETQNQVATDPCLIIEVSPNRPPYSTRAVFVPDSHTYNANDYETWKEIFCWDIKGNRECMNDLDPLDDSNWESELKSRLSGYIKTCQRRYKSDRHFRLELILPLSLMNYPIESWELEYGVYENTLIPGCTFPVVVRSYDRTTKEYQDELGKQWEENWERLEKNITYVAHNCLADVSAEVKAPQLNAAYIANSKTVGFKLSEVLQRSLESNFLGALLGSATPVAVWLRHIPLNSLTTDENPVKKYLNEFLQYHVSSPCPMDNLLDRAQQVRAKAITTSIKPDDKKFMVGHHLSLLWENPKLLPPLALKHVSE